MFLDTKHAVDRLTQDLLNSRVRAAALHGGKSQPQRTRTPAQLKTGHVTVLVATNVAARGIHVDNLDLVTLVTRNQRRGMVRLMADAGIRPQTTQIHSGDEALRRITGAQAASGIPVAITAPAVERPKRSRTSRGRRRSSSATWRNPVRRPVLDAVA